MERRIGLIVPVYKNFEGFAELMHSVDMAVIPYVIPNWKDNIGVSKAWNKGILQAGFMDKCDAVFVVNDDVVFERGTMQNMLLGLAEGHDLVTGYNTRDENYDDVEKVAYLDEPDFSCFAIRPIPFTLKFGTFDENFSPAYFEDNDMAYRISIGGGSAKKHTKAPFFHKGSVTQNWGGSQVVTMEMFEKNRSYYAWKWGGEPGQETLTTPNTLPVYTEEGIGLNG